LPATYPSQYSKDLPCYLALLSAEDAYDQAVIAVVQAEANRHADTAALFEALGGGWWNRADLAIIGRVKITGLSSLSSQSKRFMAETGVPPARV